MKAIANINKILVIKNWPTIYLRKLTLKIWWHQTFPFLFKNKSINDGTQFRHNFKLPLLDQIPGKLAKSTSAEKKHPRERATWWLHWCSRLAHFIFFASWGALRKLKANIPPLARCSRSLFSAFIPFRFFHHLAFKGAAKETSFCISLCSPTAHFACFAFLSRRAGWRLTCWFWSDDSNPARRRRLYKLAAFVRSGRRVHLRYRSRQVYRAIIMQHLPSQARICIAMSRLPKRGTSRRVPRVCGRDAATESSIS